MATIWGIRSAIQLSDQSLTQWAETEITKHYGCDEVAVQLRQGSITVVRAGADLAKADDTTLTSAGIEVLFAHSIMLMAAYDMHPVYLAPIYDVRHAGWTLRERSWLALSLPG